MARVLPLAEVLNNQGVAVSRRGNDGTPLFRQAIAADPDKADYHFNLAVSLKRHGDSAGALNELVQCLKLRSNDTEAQGLEETWKASPGDLDLGPGAELKADPLERIVRTFDAQAFRQAALMLDQVEAAGLAALPPQDRAKKLAGQAQSFLDRGLLLEAERLYLSAEAADSKVAEAHAGLAQVRERTGDAEAARTEARAALGLTPSADAYLVLGRLDVAVGNMGEAKMEVNEALKLAPASRAAHDLRHQIEAWEAQKN